MKIRNYFVVTITVLSLMLIQAQHVHAGGGRMELYEVSGSPWHYGDAVIIAQVYTDGAHSGFSSNERLEFRVRNPKPGDYCKNILTQTDQMGVINATCYANSKRDMEVYLVSLDRGDDSSSYILHFLDKPTPAPTKKPIVTTAPVASAKPIESLKPEPIELESERVNPVPTEILDESPEAIASVSPSPSPLTVTSEQETSVKQPSVLRKLILGFLAWFRR